MTNQHPITPPPELVEQWARHILTPEEGNLALDLDWFANQAACWGADQQLAKDAEWLDQHALDAPHLKITPVGESLKEAMRPKPPTLKELALLQLDTLNADLTMHGRGCDLSQIRRAIEALPND